MKLSEPLKFAFGVYVNVPSAFTVTVPFAAPVASAQTLPPSPDGVSLPARLPLNSVSSVPLTVSFEATGWSI